MNKQTDALTPVTLPDVATEPHPTTHAATTEAKDASPRVMQDALPEINEAAKKVGGFKNLAEIAGQLGEADAGN